MPEPYVRPPAGSGAKLYRMVRDNAYYVAGTVLSLTEDQVDPRMMEPVTLPTPDADVLHGAVADLHDRVSSMEGNTTQDDLIADLADRVSALEKAAATPAPQAPREEAPKSE